MQVLVKLWSRGMMTPVKSIEVLLIRILVKFHGQTTEIKPISVICYF